MHIVSGIMHVWIMRDEIFYNTLELDKNRLTFLSPCYFQSFYQTQLNILVYQGVF